MFLRTLGIACERYGGICHAFCLMDNHYHVLMESCEGRLSRLMQHLNGTYGRWFNIKRDRCGHLFQGRFKSSLIDRESYLMEVTRYIELNPCRAGLVSHPGEWRWSSFRARMEQDSAERWFEAQQLLTRFGSGDDVRRRYESFVLAGLQRKEIGSRLRRQSILGTPEFVARHAVRAKDRSKIQRVPRMQTQAARRALEELVSNAAIDHRTLAAKAVLDHGHSMSDVARRMKVHHTTIGRWVDEEEQRRKGSDCALQ
ncbi:MAG: addiction module toxin RelE [bacterium]|nr:addiction module toxin RelE [bacterium]